MGDGWSRMDELAYRIRAAEPDDLVAVRSTIKVSLAHPEGRGRCVMREPTVPVPVVEATGLRIQEPLNFLDSDRSPFRQRLQNGRHKYPPMLTVMDVGELIL